MISNLSCCLGQCGSLVQLRQLALATSKTKLGNRGILNPAMCMLIGNLFPWLQVRRIFAGRFVLFACTSLSCTSFVWGTLDTIDPYYQTLSNHASYWPG